MYCIIRKEFFAYMSGRGEVDRPPLCALNISLSDSYSWHILHSDNCENSSTCLYMPLHLYCIVKFDWYKKVLFVCLCRIFTVNYLCSCWRGFNEQYERVLYFIYTLMMIVFADIQFVHLWSGQGYQRCTMSIPLG